MASSVVPDAVAVEKFQSGSLQHHSILVDEKAFDELQGQSPTEIDDTSLHMLLRLELHALFVHEKSLYAGLDLLGCSRN